MDDQGISRSTRFNIHDLHFLDKQVARPIPIQINVYFGINGHVGRRIDKIVRTFDGAGDKDQSQQNAEQDQNPSQIQIPFLANQLRAHLFPPIGLRLNSERIGLIRFGLVKNRKSGLLCLD